MFVHLVVGAITSKDEDGNAVIPNYEDEAFYLMLFDITSHSNSHFAIGINAVLIPQSIFTNSYLNRLVQQKDATNMPTYLKEADFSGIGEGGFYIRTY